MQFPVPATSADLRRAITYLNPAARRAIHAATAQTLRRGTWDGCAFNAAGHTESATVTSSRSAANLFGLPRRVVEHFIGVWDRMRGSDEQLTAELRALCEQVGLDTPAVVPHFVLELTYDPLAYHEEAYNDLLEILDGEAKPAPSKPAVAKARVDSVIARIDAVLATQADASTIEADRAGAHMARILLEQPRAAAHPTEDVSAETPDLDPRTITPQPHAVSARRTR